jgi:hypothetical protein
MDGRMDGRLDGWMDGWMDGRTDGRPDGRTDGWMSPCRKVNSRPVDTDPLPTLWNPNGHYRVFSSMSLYLIMNN